MSKPEFILTKDKERARIRFLYNSIEDVVPTEITDPARKERNKSFIYNSKALEIPIYNEDAKCEQVWVRSIFAYHTLERLYKDYTNVPAYIFEITRHGESGDIHTIYEITCLGKE